MYKYKCKAQIAVMYVLIKNGRDNKKNPGGDEIFLPSRPAQEPTQPPVKWVPDLSQ